MNRKAQEWGPLPPIPDDGAAALPAHGLRVRSRSRGAGELLRRGSSATLGVLEEMGYRVSSAIDNSRLPYFSRILRVDADRVRNSER